VVVRPITPDCVAANREQVQLIGHVMVFLEATTCLECNLQCVRSRVVSASQALAEVRHINR
jgi:hypothetical protein